MRNAAQKWGNAAINNAAIEKREMQH